MNSSRIYWPPSNWDEIRTLVVEWKFDVMLQANNCEFKIE